MATKIWVNFGSGNGLLPGGTMPLHEPVSTYHQQDSVAFIEGYSHKKMKTQYSQTQLKITI